MASGSISCGAVRLGDGALAGLPPDVAGPRYDRTHTHIGIVHFGPGAFHRAHQAAYVDDLLCEDPRWAICGVSLHSRGVRDALRPQDGLYTLALLEAAPSMRVIGSIRELLCAPDERPAVLTRLADPAVRLVTLTVTEKGYCMHGDSLDLSHREIAHDLAAPQAPTSVIGYLVAGLRERQRHGLQPYTVLSCDNLADNGQRLRRAVLQYARRVDTGLAAWIEANVGFPRSVVDSITPASDEALRHRVAARLGCVDAWPVQREPYAQWAIEDAFCNDRPAFERAGVTVSRNIEGHDRAKLRLLNGAHSTLAYLGLLMDIETVADAMRHPLLSGFVEQLMREDIVPSLDASSGFDPYAYVDAILGRFRNPEIHHLLSQIAWDGSQKLPVRILGTVADALATGRRIGALCVPVAAWMRFVCRQARNGKVPVDPLADALMSIGRAATGSAQHDVDAFLGLDSVFVPLSGDARFVEAVRDAYAAFGDGSPAAAVRMLESTSR
ncbi:MAG: mannitol dehydrogenase family protein [Rhodanobacteraceae bacterium]